MRSCSGAPRSDGAIHHYEEHIRSPGGWRAEILPPRWTHGGSSARVSMATHDTRPTSGRERCPMANGVSLDPADGHGESPVQHPEVGGRGVFPPSRVGRNRAGNRISNSPSAAGSVGKARCRRSRIRSSHPLPGGGVHCSSGTHKRKRTHRLASPLPTPTRTAGTARSTSISCVTFSSAQIARNPQAHISASPPLPRCREQAQGRIPHPHGSRQSR